MRSLSGLALLASGAVLAFAVHAHVPGFHLTAIGWILMLAGVAGMIIPARRSGWLRRRMVVGGTMAHTLHPDPAPRRPAALPPASPAPAPGQATPAQRAPGPRVQRDPAAVAAKILRDAQVVPADPGAGRTAASKPAAGRPAATPAASRLRRSPNNRQAPA